MILSWDIGIKNLSYCILSILDEQNNSQNDNNSSNQITLNDITFVIHHWDVINLVDALEKYNKLSNSENSNRESVNLISNFSQRNKINCKFNKCKRVSKYCFNNSHNEGYCTNHFNKLEDKEKKDYFYIGDKIPKCQYESCKKKSTFILESHHYKSYCTIHQKKLIKTCPKIKTLKMEKKIKATHINLNHLGEILYRELDKYSFLLNNKITNVLLENQPVLKNPTMKSMQMFLYGYFLLRGKIDKQNKFTVNCYSANQKNTLIKYLDDESKFRINDEIKHIKSKYIKNKKESIMITEVLLRGCDNLKEWFESHKKKDDLADSLLMNIHYLIKNNSK